MSSPELQTPNNYSNTFCPLSNIENPLFSYSKKLPELVDQINEARTIFYDFASHPKENLPIILNESGAIRDTARYLQWKYRSGEIAHLPKAEKGEEKQILMLPGLGGSPAHYTELSSILRLGGHTVEHGYSYDTTNRFSWNIIESIKNTTLRMVEKNNDKPIVVNAHSKGCMDALVVGKMIEEEEGIYPFEMHIFQEGPIRNPVIDAYEDNDNSVFQLMDLQMAKAGLRDGLSLPEMYLWALSEPKPDASVLSFAIPKDPIVPYNSSIPYPHEGIAYDLADTTHILGPYNPEAITISMQALTEGPEFIRKRMPLIPDTFNSGIELIAGEEMPLIDAA